ncbi:hypothetical protein LTR66_000503 [Elasticomyces elasticus]|nr:hypothetical protein LTR66_000503 [Elasticomyces elasticus]
MSGAWKVLGGYATTSDSFGPSTWDSSMAELLRMKGQGNHTVDRMTIHYGNGVDKYGFLDFHAMTVSDNYTVTYPGGAQYTLDVGFLSLYGGSQTFSWTASNGTIVTRNRTLPDAYTAGYIPSMSYGLHIGSVTPNVSGSLLLGGYDSSRCLTSPIVSNSQTFSLVDIHVNVSQGGSAFIKLPGGFASGLLQSNGNQVNQINAMPNPGVPYLYLPQSTCDAIAKYLPVTYNQGFGLYFWNTHDSAYQNIVSSPSYLGFTFASGTGQNSSINVPFALLKLTLESPLVSTPTQYFPCSPFTPSDGMTYHLGRAFLQAAFLAQNWQTNKLFLAQAPGPAFLPQNIKSISATDSSLSPATNPPDWASTWSGTLKALSGSTSLSADSSSSSSSGLSGGAIAGIVVGVVVGVLVIFALAFLAIRRRKRKQNPQEDPQAYVSVPQSQDHSQNMVHADKRTDMANNPAYVQPFVQDQYFEADAGRAISEMDGQVIRELPADVPAYRGNL